jgi:hypothetical protein
MAGAFMARPNIRYNKHPLQYVTNCARHCKQRLIYEGFAKD